MTTTTAANFERNLRAYLDQVARLGEPVTIAGDGGNAVLISEEQWRSVQETLYLRSVPGLVDSILEASREKTEDMVVYDPSEEW